MHAVHVHHKLPIDWQIYPESPEVSSVIASPGFGIRPDCSPDVEDSALIYDGEEVQQDLNVQHKCKHKQCQD